MAKKSNQKLKLLYLLKILFEMTDERSGLTLSQISAELAKYNVSAERKSLYDDIEALRLFGIAIEIKRDRYVRYYISKRDISSLELRYIIDALANFSAFPAGTGYELCEKLVKFYGVRGRSYLKPSDEVLYKAPKSLLDDLSKNLETIELALTQGKKICCKEFVWNSKKQRVVVDGGNILTLTPIWLGCIDKYLLCAYDGKDVRIYRVENLFDVSISSEDSARAEEYGDLLNGRFRLDFENVRLDCDASFAGEVFDRFGLNVTVLSSREERFEITVKVKLDDSFYSWLFNSAKHVRIVAPERVKDEYKERLLLAIDNVNREH